MVGESPGRANAVEKMARMAPSMSAVRRLQLVFLATLCACAGPRTNADPLVAEVTAMGLHDQAAQTLAAPLRLAGDTAAPDLRAQVATGSVGAIMIRESPDPAEISALQGLRAVAPWPLLAVVADLQVARGAAAGRRMPAYLVDDSASAGFTAAEAVGSLAPVLGLISLPPLQPGVPFDPAIRDPERTATRLVEYLDAATEAGLASGVVLLAPINSVDATVTWDRRRLEAVELREISHLLQDRHPPALLLSAIRIPSVAGDSTLLPLSPAAVSGLLRRDLEYEGVVAAELSDVARQEEISDAGAAIALLASGVDLLLGADNPAAVVDAVVEAVETGTLPAARVEEAALRVLRLRRSAMAAGDAAVISGADSIRRRSHAGRVADSGAEGGAGENDASAPAPVLRAVAADSVGMDEGLPAAIDVLMREALRDSVFTGAAVVVGRRGGLVVSRGYGTSGRQGDGGPVTASTIFDLASLTKVIGTTTAAALLVEAGSLELDAPVRQYLPEFTGDGRELVQVHHLLTHTSGLPSGLWLFGSARSAEDALAAALRARILREPGERVLYSDLGMILLGAIVERVSGQPMDSFLAEQVFAPLGMDATMFLPPLALHGSIVPTAEVTERAFPLQGIVHDANAFRLQGVAGHAGLFGSARDVAVFAQMMLNGGRYGPGRILSPETVATFTRPRPEADNRALGWDTPSERSSAGAYFSARAYGHTGYTGTSLWIDPASELFVVLLTNRTYAEATPREILQLRMDVHDAAAQAIVDQPVRRRPGAVRR